MNKKGTSHQIESELPRSISKSISIPEEFNGEWSISIAKIDLNLEITQNSIISHLIPQIDRGNSEYNSFEIDCI